MGCTERGNTIDVDHIEALTGMIQDGVRRNVEGFTSHDDDLTPVLFVVRHKKEGEPSDAPFAVEASPIPADFFASEQAKDYFAEVVLPAAGPHYQPVAMAMVSAAWMIRYEGEAKAAYPDMTPEEFVNAVCNQYGSFGQSPYGREVVSAVVATRDCERSMTALVHRAEDGSSAWLGEWDEAEESGGRFTEGIRKALSYE